MMSERANARVAVVMAVRDDPAGLEAAAHSVLGQREVDLELIVVDDGSSEPTREALAKLTASDRRIRPVRIERSGLTAALCAGCAATRAPFVARHDAGDVSEPDRLRDQLDLLAGNAGLAFVSCWTRCLGPGGEDLQVVTGLRFDASPVRLNPTRGEDTELLGPSSHGSVVFRREAYESAGGYRMSFRLAQDWDLWWRLAARGEFASVPKALYTRRLSPASISFQQDRVQRSLGRLAREAACLRYHGGDDEDILRQAERLGRMLPGRRASPRATARGLYFIGSLLRARGDHRARGYFAQAARANPLLLRAWLRWLQTIR